MVNLAQSIKWKFASKSNKDSLTKQINLSLSHCHSMLFLQCLFWNDVKQLRFSVLTVLSWPLIGSEESLGFCGSQVTFEGLRVLLAWFLIWGINRYWYVGFLIDFINLWLIVNVFGRFFINIYHLCFVTFQSTLSLSLDISIFRNEFWKYFIAFFIIWWSSVLVELSSELISKLLNFLCQLILMSLNEIIILYNFFEIFFNLMSLLLGHFYLLKIVLLLI